MDHLLYVGMAVVGLTQVIKTLGVPTKFLPLIATIIGSLTAIALSPQTLVLSAILGMAEGLSVTGVVNFSKEFSKIDVIEKK